MLLQAAINELPAALETVVAVERVLGGPATGRVPRLLHGADATAWPLLHEAVRRRYDTRIGLEDTLRLPQGEVAADNLELIRAARPWIRR